MKWQSFFIFWLLAFPFVVWDQSYEAPKIIWLFAGSALLCLLWLVKLKDKILTVIRNADLVYFLWLFILIISSLFGVHPSESIIGGSYRHQGVIFFFAIFLVGKTIQVLDEKEKTFLLRFLGYEVIAESLLVLVKPLGTFGERNAVSGFLVMASTLSDNWTAMALAFSASALAASRSAVLAFMANIFRLPKKFRLVLIPIFAVVIFVFLYAGYSKPDTSVFENRRVIAKIAIGEIIKRPILGYGAESGEAIYSNYFKEIGMPLSELSIDRAHNLFLDVWLWSGAVGFVLFAAWFFLRSKEVYSAKKWGRLAGMASFLIFSFFQPLGVVHWLLLVIIFDL